MVQVLPAILAKTSEDYKEKLKVAEKIGTEWIQIDIEDQKFAPIATIGAQVVAQNPTKIKTEIQLMVEYPNNFIDDFVKARVQRIVTPVENTSGLDDVIKHIKNHGIEVGISLNPDTSQEKLEHLADDIDLVLVMSVDPGPSGQEFVEGVIPKISTLRKNYPDLNIEVDGGIDLTTGKKVAQAGANILVAGSFIFDHDDPKKQFEKLKQI